jgi:hypothetical protein
LLNTGPVGETVPRNLLLALIIAVSGFQTAVAQVVIEPSDRPVSLTGVIKEIHGYGPPGYGENKKTDPPVTYLAIELARPINTPCTPERPEWKSVDCAATKLLKLFFPSSDGSAQQLELSAKQMKGRRVVITGTLERQTTAGEYTPIVFNVMAIDAAKN